MRYRTIATKNMSHQEWLRLRKSGIGGSDAGAIYGLSPYASPINIYCEKVSEAVSENDSEAMRQGRDLEDYVARRFMETTGKRVRRSNQMYWSLEHPFMFADVDRLVDGEDAGLECKTASAYQADQWKDGKVPEHYLCQCYHYMAVTGRRAWYIAAVVLGQGFYYTKVLWDDKVIRELIAVEEKFWTNCVKAGKMPEPDGSEVCDRILNCWFSVRDAAEPKEFLTLTGFDQRIERRMEIEQALKLLEKEQKKIDQEIKIAMGEHERALSGAYQISWKSVVSNRLDMKRLKVEHPEIYRDYTQESQTRKFTVRVA